MGNKNLTRRHFLKSFEEKYSEPVEIFERKDNEPDPLFEKYARKTLTPRYYSGEYVTHRIDQSETMDSALRIGNVTSGLTPYTGAWTEWEVLHLLRRTNFGWKMSFVDRLLPLGVSAAVDLILLVDPKPPAPPVNWYQNFFADENGLAANADWTKDAFNSDTVGQTSNRFRQDAVRRWLFSLILNGDISIREKMVWFWYHFIPVDFETVRTSFNQYVSTNSARILYRYLKLFRDNATGNFKTLIRAVSTEPAMMFYLNNQKNSATAPDENFARELIELFTLGKDPASQFTENDVIEAAKVLTGWRVQNLNTTNVVTDFVQSLHSTSDKRFSAFFNDTVIAAAGAKELDAFFEMIFSKSKVVAEYICRKLYRYFVYYDIDANIEANVIAPLAQTFISNHWNILPVLSQLFKSEHFFDLANRGVYIKSPFDLVAGTLNMFKVNTVGNNTENKYRIWGYFNDAICQDIGQQMGTIPNVAGWNAYYQTPAFHELWINSNTIQRRFDFIQGLFAGYTLNFTLIKIDVIAFVQRFGASVAADPDFLVAACIKYLLPVDLSQSQKDQFKTSSLLGGQLQNHYWTNAWNDYLAAPTNAPRKGIVETRLKTLLSGLCQLAEFQLM